MSEDLIAGNFVDNINRNIIKRNIKLLWASLSLFSVYIIFSTIEWYIVIANSIAVKQSGMIVLNFRITPVVILATFILGIYQWYFYLKGHQLILLSFERDNPDLFNSGYLFISKATTLNIIGYSIVITVSIFRFILKFAY